MPRYGSDWDNRAPALEAFAPLGLTPVGRPPRGVAALQNSYDFHARLERPGAFLRRKWHAIALFGGGFILAMVAIVLVIDSSFFYPRIETDQLLYLLKARTFVETGTTNAVEAINSPPFAYAAMPGILRAPFLAIFDDFDSQLRAIQLLNIAIIAAVALMFAYVLSWTLPENLHSSGIAFAFGFIALSPDWLTNVFVPLADAPYAALTMTFLITAAVVLTSEARLSSRISWIALLACSILLASAIRLTAPLLLVFAGLLTAERRRRHRQSKRGSMAAALAISVAIGGIVLLNSEAIAGRYMLDAYLFLRDADKLTMPLNLLASAIPAQVVPAFNLGFSRLPHIDYNNPVFLSSARDAMWASVGVAISMIAITGVLELRRRLLPEMIYLLLALPLLALIIPGTTRYLMSYQPLIWAAFATGVAWLTRPVHARIRSGRGRLLLFAAVTVLVASMIFGRTARTARTAGGSSPQSSLAQAMAYVDDVSRTFGDLRGFLETLPADQTLLIGGGGSYGRWTVIADLDYLDPDSTLSSFAAARQVYALVECASAAACAGFDGWVEQQRLSLSRYGDFTFARVFEHRSANARAIVHRLRPAGARTSSERNRGQRTGNRATGRGGPALVTGST